MLTDRGVPITDRDRDDVVEAILAVSAARDTTMLVDARAIGAWCRRLAAALHLPRARAELAVIGGLLRDIGEIATPEAILFKRGPLSELNGPSCGSTRTPAPRSSPSYRALATYAPIVRAHHERWDGTGYPLGLKGEQIPLEARVVAVADAFHVLITDRPHRPALAQRDAIEILRDGRGTQWDPAVVDAMLNCSMRHAPPPGDGT